MMNMQGVGHPEPHFTLASTLRREPISSRILKCEDRVRTELGDAGAPEVTVRAGEALGAGRHAALAL